MKKIYCLFCFLYLSSLSYSQQWNWAISSTGTTTTGYNSASDVVLDSAKNAYVVGNFDAPLIFGSLVLLPNNFGVFVAKFDSTGTCLWAKKADAYTSYAGPSIALDSNQDLVITGMYYYSASFDTMTINSNGMSDIFIAKISSIGQWKWAKSFGGTSYDQGRDIKVDLNNNIYVTGVSAGTVVFDSLQVNGLGGYDAFIAKLNPNGKCIWAKNTLGSGNEKGTCIAVSSAGSLYMGGVYSGTPSVFGTSFNAVGQNDEYDFVSKLDLNGNYIWSKQLNCGAINNASGLQSINTDNLDNVYITGHYAYSCLLDTFNFAIVSNAVRNSYIAKLDPNLNVLWAKKGAGPVNNGGASIFLDSHKNCYVSGSYTDSLNYGDCALVNSGSNGYLIKLDSLGHCSCLNNITQALSVITGNDNNLWMTGYYVTSTTFGSQTFTTSNHTEAFLANVTINCSELTAINETENLDFKLTVYPNPFVDKLKIKQSKKINISLQIFNSLGVIIYQYKNVSTNHEIDLSNQPSGIYFIRAGSLTKKIIKE